MLILQPVLHNQHQQQHPTPTTPTTPTTTPTTPTTTPTTPTTTPTTLPLSTNFLTYENSILGIRIKYLNTWNVSQSFIGNNSISFIPPSKVNDSTVDNLSVQVLPSQGKTLSKWVSEQINKDMYYSKRNFGINGNFRLIESTPFNFKGNSAQNVTFASKGFVPDKTMEIYIINGNKIYTLIYFASLGRYSTYLPVIQKMIDSFQIVNTNATGAVTAGQVQASLPTQQLSNGKAAGPRRNRSKLPLLILQPVLHNQYHQQHQQYHHYKPILLLLQQMQPLMKLLMLQQ